MTCSDPRFIGTLKYREQDPYNPPPWPHTKHDFGQVTSDGRLIIAWMGTQHDGASFPWWIVPVLGRPLDAKNRFWSLPHDAGYNRTAAVIIIERAAAVVGERIGRPLTVDVDTIFEYARGLPDYCIDHGRQNNRQWWDQVQMMEAMELMGVARWRQALVYAGVRAGGGRAWRRGGTERRA